MTAGAGAGGMRRLRLGTRKSPLALAQSGLVARALEAAHPGLAVELVPIVTQGDRLPGDLNLVGGKGLFTAELEAGLLDGTLDLAVHSLKDLPVRSAEGLVVAAYPERADPRDVLVSAVATRVAELPRGARVLTGSLRRQAQLRALRPDLEPVSVRGNVETRLRKWRESGAAATVLAAAGLARLGLAEDEALRASLHPLAAEELLPAPGQGILAVQVRRGSEAETLCRALDHGPTRAAAAAERAVVTAFGGDCTLPLAAWARFVDGGLALSALLAAPDGSEVLRAEASGADGESVANECVERLRTLGADALLARLHSAVR
ncbi:MAG TPA: hydroxymethylbilane synthase [Thermoanaerobaculia bacterium]|nr:hydroxymethylbilane synthase [Thermoanaerobaculia bacterium]